MALERLIEINGMQGGCWASFSSSFHIKGTLVELKEYFLNYVNTGYSIRSEDSKYETELVTPEFFQEVGKYLLQTLEYENIRNITGTLEALNRHQRDTGNVAFDEHSTLYHTYGLIESEKFQNADSEERLSLFTDVQTKNGETFSKEAIMSNTFWTVASSYMDGSRFELEAKYPSLITGIQKLWEKEVCEKSIFPYLDRIAN